MYVTLKKNRFGSVSWAKGFILKICRTILVSSSGLKKKTTSEVAFHFMKRLLKNRIIDVEDIATVGYQNARHAILVIKISNRNNFLHFQLTQMIPRAKFSRILIGVPGVFLLDNLMECFQNITVSFFYPFRNVLSCIIPKAAVGKLKLCTFYSNL